MSRIFCYIYEPPPPEPPWFARDDQANGSYKTKEQSPHEPTWFARTYSIQNLVVAKKRCEHLRGILLKPNRLLDVPKDVSRKSERKQTNKTYFAHEQEPFVATFLLFGSETPCLDDFFGCFYCSVELRFVEVPMMAECSFSNHKS